jgi:AraC-like DNA-binding protein
MVLGIWSPLPWPPVLYEAAYSVASAIVFARRSRPENRSARAYWWPLGALVLMFCVHAGQALRFIAPRVAVDVVPLAGALGASLALLILVMTQAARSGGQRYARSALGREELQRVHAAVMRALDGPPPLYQQMDLTLTDLSAAAGAPAHHVSQALSEIAGVSFYEVLTQRRIADARRRLLEPANANIAVDALGMEAGFRSRSAFYAAFKAATGMTPAEFRRGGGKSVSATAG